MARSKFITYREMADDGVLRYYILQRDFPHSIGVVLSSPNHGAVAQSVVAGYNLFIVYDGTLRGNFIAAYPGFEEELNGVFMDMAAWYLSERILTDEKKYLKFKIK